MEKFIPTPTISEILKEEFMDPLGYTDNANGHRTPPYSHSVHRHHRFGIERERGSNRPLNT